MKIVFILLFSLFLQAECTIEQSESSNHYFAQANEERSVLKQIELLKESLKSCFAYEVEFYLFELEAQQKKDVEKKIELYDQALESLSNIENGGEKVIVEQNRINALLAKLYAPIDKEIADIYEKKNLETSVKKKSSNIFFYLVLLFGFFLISWVFLGFFRK